MLPGCRYESGIRLVIGESLCPACIKDNNVEEYSALSPMGMGLTIPLNAIREVMMALVPPWGVWRSPTPLPLMDLQEDGELFSFNYSYSSEKNKNISAG